MPKYLVHVCRISYQHAYIEVEASCEDEAKTKAEGIAGDFSYTEKDADYEVQSVSIKV